MSTSKQAKRHHKPILPAVLALAVGLVFLSSSLVRADPIKNESCLSKLGANAHLVIDCMEQYLQSMKSGAGTTSSSFLRAEACVAQPGFTNEQKAAAMAYASALTTDRVDLLIKQIDRKLEQGMAPSEEEAHFIANLRAQLAAAREETQKQAKEQQANIEVLKNSGATLDPGKGWEFSKFDFKKRLEFRSSAEYRAILQLFGQEAANGLRRIYFTTTEEDLIANGRPKSVVLGNTAIIPNFQINNNGNKLSREPEVMPASQLRAEIDDTYANLMVEVKNHLKAAAEINTYTDKTKAVGRALFRHFGMEQRTSAEQRFDKIEAKIKQHMMALEYRLGLAPKEMGQIHRHLQTAFHDAYNGLESATSKIDNIDVAVKATLGTALIVATAGYAAPALEIATTGTVLKFAETALAISAGITSGEAVIQAWKSNANGGGGFWCNLGEKMLAGQTQNFKWSPVIVAASLILPGAGPTAIRVFTSALLTKQILLKGGSVEAWRESNKLELAAKALRAAGHEEAAQAVERDMASLRVGAIYRPVTTVAVWAASEAMNRGQTTSQQKPSAPKPITDLKLGETVSIHRADGSVYKVTYDGGGDQHWYDIKGPGLENGTALTFTELSAFLNQAPSGSGTGALSPVRTFWSDQRGSMDVGERTLPPPTRADTGVSHQVATGQHVAAGSQAAQAQVATAATTAVSHAIVDAAITAAAVSVAVSTVPHETTQARAPPEPPTRTLKRLRELAAKFGVVTAVMGKKPTDSSQLARLKMMYGTEIVFAGDVPEGTGPIKLNKVVLHIGHPKELAKAYIGIENPFLDEAYEGVVDNKWADWLIANEVSPDSMAETTRAADLADFWETSEPKLTPIREKLKSGKALSEPEIKELEGVVTRFIDAVKKRLPDGAFIKRINEAATADNDLQVTTFSSNPEKQPARMARRFAEAVVEIQKTLKDKNTSVGSDEFRDLIDDLDQAGPTFVSAFLFKPETLMIQKRVRIAKMVSGETMEFRVDFVHGEAVRVIPRYGYSEIHPEEKAKAVKFLNDFFAKATDKYRRLSGGSDIAFLEDGSMVFMEFNFGSESSFIMATELPLFANDYISKLLGHPTPMIQKLEEAYQRGPDAMVSFLKSLHKEHFSETYPEEALASGAQILSRRLVDDWVKNPTEDGAKAALKTMQKILDGITDQTKEEDVEMTTEITNSMRWFFSQRLGKELGD